MKFIFNFEKVKYESGLLVLTSKLFIIKSSFIPINEEINNIICLFISKKSPYNCLIILNEYTSFQNILIENEK